MHSFTEENYLKTIYKLGDNNVSEVNTSSLAEYMGIKSSTVTDMLKKLADKKLVKYEKYKGVRLNEDGKKIAVKIIRRHRLWEVFLLEKLNFGWSEVHEMAEELEHIQNDEMIERLDKLLGFPKYDPHGDPIPDSNGNFSKNKFITLFQAQLKKSYTVVGITDHDEGFIKYLDKIGITLNSKIMVSSLEEYDKSLKIKVNSKKETYVSKIVADNILVE
jgi:DtxR family transcriptional regulator, Mn-dependent transcriptional regulator